MNTRRDFIKNSILSLGLISLPSLLMAERKPSEKAKKIVCIGGHLDDPESGQSYLVKLQFC